MGKRLQKLRWLDLKELGQSVRGEVVCIKSKEFRWGRGEVLYLYDRDEGPMALYLGSYLRELLAENSEQIVKGTRLRITFTGQEQAGKYQRAMYDVEIIDPEPPVEPDPTVKATPEESADIEALLAEAEARRHG